MPEGIKDRFADKKRNAGFYWSKYKEPHEVRRKEILNKYPEMKKLFGPDIRNLYMILITVTIQFVTCYCVRDMDWFLNMFP